MLLITKTTTIFLWFPPDHQIQSQNHLIRHKKVKLHFNPPSISSQLLSPIVTTKSHTRIPATFSLTSTSDNQIADHYADISRFCEMGNLQKAMNLISNSENINLDLKTYCDILQLCAESNALHHGKKVHKLICFNGIEIDSVLGSKLVFMYVSCGDLIEGRRIFDNILNLIPKENVFLWNFVMNAYAKNGEYEESVYLFIKMLEIGAKPDAYTFTCIIKCLATIENKSLGEMIHGYVLKLGFGFNNTVVNSMINFYFKHGNMNNAHQLFDNLPDRDVITWNSIISGYVANGHAEKGFKVFINMINSEVSIDLATLVNLVIACTNMNALNLGKTVHAYAVKNRFYKNTIFNNTLLDMYSKCGDLDAALKVFKNMDEKCVVSWTAMIAGYARDGEFDKAINLFLEMKGENVKPDNFTVTSILHACSSNHSLEKGKEVHDYIKENKIQSLHVSNALMDMYAKCGSMNDSYSVFSETRFKDIVSWNTMIGGFSKNCLPNESLNLFIKMQDELKPDNVTMTCVLPACASLAALNKGREIHGYILRNGSDSDPYVVNALIDMYVKCGELILAKRLFDITNMKNLVTYTVMIAGYCMHGFGREALSTFKKMKENGVNPNEGSFASILYGCSHSGLLQEGWRFYNIMVHECKIEPKLEHYGCMVDLLSRVGKLSEAYKFIKSMPVKPNATIWGSLLCGCRFHHDVKLAEKVAENIFEIEPENTGYYVLLANIYSETEKWEEVKTLRGRIRRNTGFSWIEIMGKVYIFISGDKMNPEAKKIETLLQNLRMEMIKKDGFSPKLKLGFVDKDDMEKEGVVCGHSESLAMCFGVLKLPAGRTVRVTKNVGTCHECHEMAKFISKNVGRQIVLRDSNRFHHFKDGFCSCRA